MLANRTLRIPLRFASCVRARTYVVYTDRLFELREEPCVTAQIQ